MEHDASSRATFLLHFCQYSAYDPSQPKARTGWSLLGPFLQPSRWQADGRTNGEREREREILAYFGVQQS